MQKIYTIDLGGVNSYLIEKNNRFILVDTGGHMFMDKEYSDRRELLDERIKDYGVNDTNLELIILTHGDNDHACNASYFKEKYNGKIAMGKDDVFLVDNPKADVYKINSKYKSLLLSVVFKIMDSKIEKLMEKVYSDFESFKPDILLEDGNDLLNYGFEGKIIASPGHTRGSICILDNEGNLICGDALACNKNPDIAMNAENFETLRESVRNLLKYNVKKIYPGHGKVFDRSLLKFK